MRRVLMLSVVGCIAGCSSPSATSTDAPVVDTDTLAPTAARLNIAWLTDLGTTFPTEVVTDLDVADVKFRMENLHAEVSVSPGDPRTTRAEVQLHWDASSTPQPVTFLDAPAGLYSNVVLKLDEGDGENALEIAGTVDVGGTVVDFRIVDIDSRSVAMAVLPTALDLELGANVTLLVEFQVAGAIAAVDFSTLPEEDNTRLLEKGDPQMTAFRNALQFAVTVAP